MPTKGKLCWSKACPPVLLCNGDCHLETKLAIASQLQELNDEGSAVSSSCLPHPRMPPQPQHTQTTLGLTSSWQPVILQLGYTRHSRVWALSCRRKGGARARCRQRNKRESRSRPPTASSPRVAQNTKATLGRFTLEPEAAVAGRQRSFIWNL